MSSFKRKTTSKETSLPVGTRALPAPIATFITSTGVPSLDDILGGGLPLSCDLLILAPDVHSAYGELLQKYFIVQGLSSGQDVCVIDDFAREFVSECMWIAGNDAQAAPSGVADEDVDEDINDPEAKIKIAWRYGQLKQFQTTVPSSFQSNGDFCRVFDLTTRIPTSLVEDSSSSGQLVYIDVNSASADAPCTRRILRQVELLLGAEVDTNGTVTRKPLRLCIPSLGSPQWDDLEPQEICSFLHCLRVILRQHTHAVAAISLSPHLCSDTWGGPGWTQKLGWLSDACLSLAAFTANPSLTSMFPAHHGFFHIHSLPASHTLQSPSDRFSSLRGLSSSGENNLAFKCMRKRLVFETLHLDLEGGVGERRTTPATSATVPDSSALSPHHHNTNLTEAGVAAIGVKMEQVRIDRKAQVVEESNNAGGAPTKRVKPKKKVAFQSDRPDLYDF